MIILMMDFKKIYAEQKKHNKILSNFLKDRAH
jgi:hypothetical protein